MPLPKKLSRTIKKFARRDGKISKKFIPYLDKPGDMPLFILSQNGRGNVKWLILGVIDKWTAEFKEHRDRVQFSVSTIREDFGRSENETFYQIINRASHVAKGNGEVYDLKDGDTVQAHLFDFSYKFYGRLESQRFFDIADAEIETQEV